MFYGRSRKCRNGCDISHRTSVHISFVHYPIPDHSLCGANQVRMINLTRNGNCENFCVNALTFSVKSGLQSFCVRVDLHLFKTSILIACFVLSTVIHWIPIYLVDSVIQPLNDCGLHFFVLMTGDCALIYLLLRLANCKKPC